MCFSVYINTNAVYINTNEDVDFVKIVEFFSNHINSYDVFWGKWLANREMFAVGHISHTYKKNIAIACKEERFYKCFQINLQEKHQDGWNRLYKMSAINKL